MTCDFCSCTDDRACDGGCFWVKHNVCSVCWLAMFVERAMENGAGPLALAQLDEAAAAIAEQRMDETAELVAQAPLPTLPRLWRPGDPI
jgi:hypothetical protein